MIQINGDFVSFSQAAKILNQKPNTIVCRKRRGWTDLEIKKGKREIASKSKLVPLFDQIKSDRKSGMTLTDLAKKYNYDHGNMSRLCKKIGIKINLNKNDLLTKKVRNLRKKNLSASEIAKRLDIKVGSAYFHLAKAGCKALPKPSKQIVTQEKIDRKNQKLRKWRNENKEQLALIRKSRRETDILFALKERVRATTGNAFRRRRYSKNTKTEILLGCDWDGLSKWIESKFTDGMNWENRNLWHVDHKTPLASALTKEELVSLCHFSNLQPLWASDNMSKGAKI